MTHNDKIKQAIDLLQSLLKDEPIELTYNQVICNKIHKAIIKEFDVNPMTKGRKKEIVLARHAYRYLLKKYTTWTLERIGTQTGTNDHKSVIHSIRVAKNLIDTDSNYSLLINKCEERI